MPEPKVTFVNSTEVMVEWGHEHFHKGGPMIASYEVNITHQVINWILSLTSKMISVTEKHFYGLFFVIFRT